MTARNSSSEILENQLILEVGWLEEPIFDNCVLTLSEKAQKIGLDIKTLRRMNEGNTGGTPNKQKIQNAFQLEMLGSKLPGVEELQLCQKNNEWWRYRTDLYSDCHENDRVFQEITAKKDLDTEKTVNFACAIPYSAVVKEIETAARQSVKLSSLSIPHTASTTDLKLLSEITLRDSSPDTAGNAENQATSWPKIHKAGIASNFQFSIEDDIFPLTKKQDELVRELNEYIRQFVEALRQPREFSSSFDAELTKLDNETSKRGKIKENLQNLKRLKINVLVSREMTNVSIEIDQRRLSFKRQVLHLILAPQNIFRVPFCLEDEQW
jgi:hypothetical protein